MQQVSIVVTCTERKTRPGSDELTVRSLPPGPVETRAATWISRLEHAQGEKLSALELYTGNHWHVVKGLLNARPDLQVRLWVASAGYGLIPVAAQLRPYAATFARGVDSVGTLEEARRWWELLSGWQGPAPGSPRTIADLARHNPDTPLLVVASAAYGQVLSPDLGRAAATARASRLALLSAGLRISPGIEALLVPSDARYKSIVGGQMHSLNVRLAQLALEQADDWYPDTSALRALFSSRLESLPSMPSFDRTPMSDDDVILYIREQLTENPRAGHTTLLRQLRASGRACEQSRFKRLFEATKSETSR